MIQIIGFTLNLPRNKCNNMRKELAKIDYYHRLFAVNKGNSKEIWNTINEFMSRSSKSQNISSLLINKKVVTNNTEIAESLNQYFAEIGITLKKVHRGKYISWENVTVANAT